MSIATATAMMMPLMTCCHIGEMLINCRPYWMTEKIRTPETMPPTLPIPPFSETPPTTQAAIASSS